LRRFGESARPKPGAQLGAQASFEHRCVVGNKGLAQSVLAEGLRKVAKGQLFIRLVEYRGRL
jgi:hypothetical protein